MFTITTSNAVEKCNYPTNTETDSHWGGAPWSSNTWNSSEVKPEGPCENFGAISELACVKKMKFNGYDCYQMTKGNSYRRYNGTLWGGVKRKYDLCFACYK